MTPAPTDPAWFRRVLGQYPTGVCVVTALTGAGTPTGTVVGSFTSVSLEPPMVAFYPSTASQTWPELSGASSFCVNVLAADQEKLCRQFATAPAERRFDGVGHRPAPAGAPVLDGVVAWIECTPTSIQPAGDHYLVLGAVTHLQTGSPRLPLLFLRGGYGSFSPLTFTTSDAEGVLARQLRHLDIVRPVLQSLSDSGLRCLVTTRSSAGVVVVGQFDPPTAPATAEPATLVGQVLPFRPPGPSVFHAWSPTDEVEDWLGSFPPALQASEHAALDAIRSRGYSVGLVGEGQRRFALALEQLAVRPGTVPADEIDDLIAALDYDPPELTTETLRSVRLVTAPVFGPDGRVALAVTAYGFPHDPDAVTAVVDRLTGRTAAASRLLGGHPHD